MTHWIPGSGSPQAAPPAPARAKRSKWISVGVPVICSVLAFGLGSAAGSGGSDAQHTALVASEKSLTADLEQANQEVSDADEALEAAEEAVAEAEDTAKQAEAQAAKTKTDLDAQKKQVLSLQAQVDSYATEVDGLNASNQALAAQVAELQNTSAPTQFVDSGTSTDVPQTTSTSTYYENCDAVRAAGAAPLYVDSPGYSRKLDRDGDGVACE